MARKALVMLLMVIGLMTAGARNAAAGCTTDLIDCFYVAASEESFWRRTAMGLDCELAYVGCVRKMILGY